MEKFDKLLNYANFYALVTMCTITLIGAIKWICIPNIVSALFFGLIAFGSAWLASTLEELKEPREQLVSFCKNLISKIRK